MKRFLSLLMALTLVLALSACNSGTQPAPSSTAPPPLPAALAATPPHLPRM